MEAKLYGQNKGGMSINGIIKDYYAYAGENISAGDLVEYVNGIAGKVDYGESVDTQLSTNAYTGYAISAVALDENRIFIAHSYGGSLYLYGTVVSIDGSTITTGTTISIKETTNGGKTISTVLLPNGNVFIAHCNGANEHLYGIVCVIDGTTITKGTDTAISSYTDAGYTISACLLPSGNVFIAHSYGTGYILYGVVVTINGTTITAGTVTKIGSGSNSGSTISTCLLPNGNVFIAHSYGSNYYLYGIVVSISGTTITAGSDTAIVNTSSSYAGQQMSTCLLADGNVFIAHRHTNTMYLYGIVCSIDGTTITKGTDTAINSSVPHTDYGVSPVLLPNGNVFISHAQYIDTKHHLYGVICSIEGTKITVGEDTPLNVSDNSTAWLTKSLLLSNGMIFTAHSYTENNYYLYAQIFGIDYDNNIPTKNISITEYETQVRKVTTGQFDGIAKTSGEGSPEFVEGEVKKTGNIIPTEWTKVLDLEYTTDGITLTASSSYGGSNSLDSACDGIDGSYYQSKASSNERYEYIQWEFDKPQKISKMFAILGVTSAGDYGSIVIQGSNNNNDWIDLFSVPLPASNGEYEYEIELSNTDYYKYYRIYAYVKENSLRVFEWQTSEYIEKGLVPSTGHKDIVSIWTKE